MGAHMQLWTNKRALNACPMGIALGNGPAPWHACKDIAERHEGLPNMFSNGKGIRPRHAACDAVVVWLRVSFSILPLHSMQASRNASVQAFHAGTQGQPHQVLTKLYGMLAPP
jgi:hypothetical protein